MKRVGFLLSRQRLWGKSAISSSKLRSPVNKIRELLIKWICAFPAEHVWQAFSSIHMGYVYSPDVTKWCSARQAAFDLAKSLEYRNAWNLWQNVCVGQYWNSLDVPRVLSEAGRFSHLRSALGQSLRLSNKFIVFTVKGLLQRVTCFKKPRHSCHGRSSSLTKHNWNANLHPSVNKTNANFTALTCVVLKNLNDCKYKSKAHVLRSHMVTQNNLNPVLFVLDNSIFKM